MQKQNKTNILTKYIFSFKNLLLVFCIFVKPVFCFTQIDSLKNIIRNSSNDSEIARTYNILSDNYLDVDMEISKKYADSAKVLGQKILDYKIISDSYVNYANSYYYQGNLDSALSYFEKSYYTITKSSNKNEIGAALNRIGLIHEAKSNFSKAAEYYYKALSIYEETNYLKGKAEILNNLGVINDAMGNVDEALLNYKKSLKYFKEADIYIPQANVYNNIATLFANNNKVDTAIIYIKLAIRILSNDNLGAEAATTYFNAAVFYEKLGVSDSAQLFMDSSLFLYRQVNNIHGIANVYNEEAKKLINSRDYQNAIDLLNKSLDLRKKVGNVYAESITVLQLSDCYLDSGDFERALQYYKEYIVLRDSVFNTETENVISELEIKYQTEKKDKEITILKNEAEIKKSHNRLLIFISIALTVISVLLFYFFRIKTRLLSSQKKYYEQQEMLSNLEIEKQETERELLEKEVKTQQQINELQKKRFEAELDHSKRELVTTTMQVLNKNKILNEIKEYLGKLEPYTPEERRSYKELQKMISDNINLDSDWDQLKIHFEKVNTGFFEKLQQLYPELSQGDLKVCAYIKIKLSSKEIANMMNISLAGINKRLYRIRRKMNLPVHSNIAEYLDKIK